MADADLTTEAIACPACAAQAVAFLAEDGIGARHLDECPFARCLGGRRVAVETL